MELRSRIRRGSDCQSSWISRFILTNSGLSVRVAETWRQDATAILGRLFGTTTNVRLGDN